MLPLGSSRLRCPFSDHHRQTNGQETCAGQEPRDHRDSRLHVRTLLGQDWYLDYGENGESCLEEPHQILRPFL